MIRFLLLLVLALALGCERWATPHAAELAPPQDRNCRQRGTMGCVWAVGQQQPVPANWSAEAMRAASLQPAECPCLVAPEFAALAMGEARLVACTDDEPFLPFVRIVDEHLNLAALFESSRGAYCGWQAGSPDAFTVALPVTALEWRACKIRMRTAAARQGIRCSQDL